jgi:CheY-like chemotaxis protein
MRLLWVENHAVFARLAGRQFLSAHAVTVVGSLGDARQALAGHTFDAVLVDFDLDDGKGVTLVDFVRQMLDRPTVIAVSAHEAGNNALLQAGADAACSKMRFAQIEIVLDRALADRGKG